MRVLFSRGIAAISKPRCGSTSVRRMLDPFLARDQGDLAVNLAGENPPFHPHITAPYLRELLAARDSRAGALEYMITTRHPVTMLWSYYKFFRPDAQSRYNFTPGWSAADPMPFEGWILQGRVGASQNWLRLGPETISTLNLSPLSLEAHAVNADGTWAVDRIFRIEEPQTMIDWIEEKVQARVPLIHTNESAQDRMPALGSEALLRIRTMFPWESRLYNV